MKIDVNWWWAAVVSVFSYVICPNSAYVPAVIAVWVAVVLDIFTRWYANARNGGGLYRALKSRAINSDAFWDGTKSKIVSYLVVQILAGLTMRVEQWATLSGAVVTVIYSIMFIREFISNLENLQDAGANWVGPLLCFMRKKEKEITKNEEE